MPTGQGQSQPGALLFRRAATALLEGLEDPLPVLRRYADAGVGHGHLQLVPAPPRGHGDPAAVRGELDRVREQVDHHLLEPQLVGVDGPDVFGDEQRPG